MKLKTEIKYGKYKFLSYSYIKLNIVLAYKILPDSKGLFSPHTRAG